MKSDQNEKEDEDEHVCVNEQVPEEVELYFDRHFGMQSSVQGNLCPFVYLLPWGDALQRHGQYAYRQKVSCSPYIDLL